MAGFFLAPPPAILVLLGADSLHYSGGWRTECIRFLLPACAGTFDTLYVAALLTQGWGDSIHRQQPMGSLLPPGAIPLGT